MTVTYKGVVNANWNKDNNSNITAIKKLIYWVDAGESSVIISRQTEIPLIGTAHPEDETLLLTNISISDPQEGDERKKHKYTVTLTYTRPTNFSETPIQDTSISPWRKKAFNISISPLEKVVPFVKAYATPSASTPTIPVLNPVGDAYEDETVEQNVIIRFSYNRSTFNSSWVRTYIESVNSSGITVVGVSVPARKGKIRTLSANYLTQDDENGDPEYKYWQIDAEIEVSQAEWKKEIMIRGLYFKDNGKNYRIYTDNDGNFGKKDDMGANAVAVDEPQRLTETGALYTGSTAEFDIFYDKRQLSWGTLGFPNSVT
jgi:hypothetical protein